MAPERDETAGAAPPRRHGDLGGLDLAQDGAGVVGERLARLRELDGPLAPVEQRNPHPAFQRGDVHADARLGAVGGLGGRHETARVDDGEERDEPLQPHVAPHHGRSAPPLLTEPGATLRAQHQPR
jgi:hypothetical protein